MIRLRFSKRWFRYAGMAAACLALLYALYLLGAGLTPLDADGRPLIMSPTVRTIELYRRSASGWVEHLRRLDAAIDRLLVEQGQATDPAQLYTASEQAQALVERASSLAREAEFATPPPALSGLSEQARAATLSYLETALAAARWLSAPTPDSYQASLLALERARQARAHLESSRWLTMEDERE